ncbi:MAG: hypothetical protein KAH15_03590 [Candidatus Marinimicrobia bacterium]|nr:hypothetical protein [Candidatus Neomarinimicrobiota bacterium]
MNINIAKKTIVTILFIVFGVNNLLGEAIKRDSNEWNDLSVSERWQAVNIAEDQLEIMSTYDLLIQCLDFDFMWDIFNHPNLELGLNAVIGNYNALNKLLNQNDAGRIMLNYYNSINPQEVTSKKDLIQKGEFAGRILFTELFITYPKVIEQFKGNEKEVINSILDSYDKCMEVNRALGKEYYSNFDFGIKVLTIGRLQNQAKGNENTNLAIKNLDLHELTDELYQDILNKARLNK